MVLGLPRKIRLTFSDVQMARCLWRRQRDTNGGLNLCLAAVGGRFSGLRPSAYGANGLVIARNGQWPNSSGESRNSHLLKENSWRIHRFSKIINNSIKYYYLAGAAKSFPQNEKSPSFLMILTIGLEEVFLLSKGAFLLNR